MNIIAAGGSQHTVCLDLEGQVWSFGANEEGQLGHGDSIPRATPCIIPTLNCIVSVACGEKFSLCVDIEGICWGFGNNSKGQLGLGSGRESQYFPQKIQKLPPIKTVRCGGYHSLFLDISGKLWAAGLNEGQLGIPKTKKTCIVFPKLVPLADDIQIKDFDCGYETSMIVSETGYVYSCGNNFEYAAGLPMRGKVKEFRKLPRMKRISKVSCCSFYSLFLDNVGNVFGILPKGYGKTKNYYPEKIPQIPSMKHIFCKEDCIILLDGENSLWTTSFIKTRMSSTINCGKIMGCSQEIDIVSTGGGHTIFKNYYGEIWCFGKNMQGQLGLGNYTSQPLPVENNCEHDFLGRRTIYGKSARK